MIKLGIKEFSRSIYSNMFIALQLAVTLIVAIACVSSVLARTKYYTPVKDFIKGKGFFIYSVTNSAMFNSVLEDFDEIDKTYSGYKVRTTFYPYSDISYGVGADALDNDYINAFEPELLAGEWLDKCDSNSNEIYGVISESTIGTTVGDTIDATYLKVVSEKTDYVDIDDYLDHYITEEINLKVKIVGVIKDNSKILGFSNSTNEPNDDFRKLYSISDKSDSNFLILSKAQMENLGYKASRVDSRIIKFKDTISDDEYTSLYRDLRQYGIIVPLEDLRHNSTSYVNGELIKLLPILISLFVLVIVSSVSISALNIKQRIREYGIFYVCGSRWKSCIVINFINNVLTSISSVVIAFIIIDFMKMGGYLANTVISFGKWQFIICCSIIIVNWIISLVMPIGIMKKNSPKSILTL